MAGFEPHNPGTPDPRVPQGAPRTPPLGDISGNLPASGDIPENLSDLRQPAQPSPSSHAPNLELTELVAPPRRGSLPGIATTLGLSLGLSVARCEGFNVELFDDQERDLGSKQIPGLDPTQPLVVLHNFHNRVEVVPGTAPAVSLPLYVDPTPADSWAISQLSLMSLHEREVTLVPRPIPGALEYALSEGLAQEGQIVALDLPCGAMSAIAHHDLLSLASNLPAAELDQIRGLGVVSAFTTDALRERIHRLGLVSIQRSDSTFADDKRKFLEKGPAYGVQTCMHIDLSDPSKLQALPNEVTYHGGWLKFSNAMGGCGLVELPQHFEVPMLRRGLQKLRDDLRDGLSASGVFSPEAESILWPPDGPTQHHFGITLEIDASFYGEKILVGSSVLEIARDGHHRTHAYFQQIIGDGGEFLGSALLDVQTTFGNKLYNKLEDQAQRIATLSVNELGFAGVCGVDFIVVLTPEKSLDVRIIELNARPPISATSYIVGSQKLDAPAWRAPYLIAREPIVAMPQLEELLTLGGRTLTRTNPESGRITPLQFGTICTNIGGRPTILRPANWCQVVVTGPSDEEVARLMDQVQASGDVRFGRPNW